VRTDDRALLARIAEGDGEAMRVLYERHATHLYRFALARLGDSREAEDVVQETMLGVWRGASTYRGESQARTWLFGVCRNKLAERLKKRGRTERPLEWPPAAGGRPPEETAAFREAFARLSAEHREVLLLVFHYGFTQEETAGILGVPVGTVKSRAHYARRRLAEALEGS